MAKLSIYKYVRTDKGWRYCKAAFHPNGKIKPNVVVVSGIEQKHTEGRYFLNFNNEWIDVGLDALEAQRKRLLRLNQMEYERLSGRSMSAASVGQPSVVAFSGRKVIRDEVESNGVGYTGAETCEWAQSTQVCRFEHSDRGEEIGHVDSHTTLQASFRK